MKKLCFIVVLACATWTGTFTLRTNSAFGQMTAFTGLALPFTNQPAIPFTNQFAFPLANQPGFTNTVVPVTNLSSLQFSDVEIQLLRLQTNIEETLPALALVTSNAADATISTTNPFTGAVTPITSNPASLGSSALGTAPGAATQSFSLTVGTNTFTIDPATLQGLVQLRDDLERALPVLQALNGTSPAAPVVSTTPAATGNPAMATLIPGAATQGFVTPFTNAPVFLPPNIPSAF